MTTLPPKTQHLPSQTRLLLLELAAKYIWWKTPDEAMRYPQGVIAQVMTIGDYADVQAMVEALGNEALRTLISRAEIGQFDERSWRYWHFRLGITPPNGEVPPLPRRRLG